jgi:hypothetical protein
MGRRLVAGPEPRPQPLYLKHMRAAMARDYTPARVAAAIEARVARGGVRVR